MANDAERILRRWLRRFRRLPPKIVFMRCVRLRREVELYNAVWMPNIISGAFQQSISSGTAANAATGYNTKCDRTHD